MTTELSRPVLYIQEIIAANVHCQNMNAFRKIKTIINVIFYETNMVKPTPLNKFVKKIRMFYT